MALAEGPAHGILAGQTHWHAVGDQRGEGKRFGVRPVDRRVWLLEGGPPPLEGAFEFGVHLEVWRKGEQRVVEGLEALPGWGLESLVFEWSLSKVLAMMAVLLRCDDRFHNRPIRLPPNAFSNTLELVQAGLEEGFRVALPNDAASDEVAGKLLSYRQLLFDGGIDPRLRQRWVIALVVAPAPVADQIDQKILTEF